MSFGLTFDKLLLIAVLALLLIAVLALLLIGPERLPGYAKRLGDIYIPSSVAASGVSGGYIAARPMPTTGGL